MGEFEMGVGDAEVEVEDTDEDVEMKDVDVLEVLEDSTGGIGWWRGCNGRCRNDEKLIESLGEEGCVGKGDGS